jgi:signal transduction histidine kinase
MTRVLDNLVDNAIADTPAGSSVHITAASCREGVVLEVQDSCGGIRENDLDRLSDPGYRGDTSRRSDGRGFGLGLAIARVLAEANGAQMSVQSLGDGCRFSSSRASRRHTALFRWVDGAWDAGACGRTRSIFERSCWRRWMPG